MRSDGVVIGIARKGVGGANDKGYAILEASILQAAIPILFKRCV
jgi:hypothetical protein